VNDLEYSCLKKRVLKLTNLDINCYKVQQMRRRLDMFYEHSKSSSMVDYCDKLEADKGKLTELVNFLAINVSEFFRDASQFVYLQNVVLPGLLHLNPRLKIWSAACSCGQEPYSIAIILDEISPGYRHWIVATDIDEGALKYARDGGPYSMLDVKNIKLELLEKYFSKNENSYWVNERLKKRVVFQNHNLLNDSFDGNFDLIICRNVIIYLSDDARDQLFQGFYRSLKPGGILFLGGSEVIFKSDEIGFKMLHPSFYTKIEKAKIPSKNNRLSEARR
jgi:chemotaxis protein methyltransferase CheR